jgi:hypothetical protein
MEPVTTGQIYWGAVPFVIIQCIMVACVISFPAMVMHYKSAPAAGPAGGQIDIQVPAFGGNAPAAPGGLGLPSGGPAGLSLPPGGPAGLGLPSGPPPIGGAAQPAAPAPAAPSIDLTKPPSFDLGPAKGAAPAAPAAPAPAGPNLDLSKPPSFDTK